MIPYLLAAIGGYLIGESQKKETEKSEAPQMADGGMMNKKKLFLTIADMMRDYFGFIKIKFAGGESDYDFENKDFYKFSEGDFDAIRIKKGTNTLILQMSDDNHITFNGQKLSVKDLFDKGDKYFFVKDDELLTFEPNGDGMSWYNNTDEFPVIVSSGLDASHFLFMFDNKSDWTNYEPSLVYEDTYAKGGMMAKGGEMADGGQLPRYYSVRFNNNYGTTAWGHTESEAINNARKSLKLGDDFKVKNIVEIKFRNGVPVSEWAKELQAKGRMMAKGGELGYGGKINFMREEYPFKTINGYIFAKYDLYDKLMDSDGKYVSKEAEEIDNRITFYLQDEEWDKSDDEIIEIWKKYSR